MGGNILKSLGVHRISPEEYIERLKQFRVLAEEFKSQFPWHYFEYGIPMPVKGKESYGDLDIVYTVECVEDVINWFSEKFESKGKKKNGNCYSVEWNELQVDFIYAKPQNFNWMTNWYSHGDHAACCGRVYRHYGFKFGHDGLYYSARSKHGAKDFLITRHWGDGNMIMGYIPPISDEYMYTQEELVEHACSTPFLVKEVLELTPDRKRPMQVLFFSTAERMKLGSLSREEAYKLGLYHVKKYSKTIWKDIRKWQRKMAWKEFFQPIKRYFRKCKYHYWPEWRKKHGFV